MDQLLDIPQGRKRTKVGRLCLLLGLTVLLYFVVDTQWGGEVGLVGWLWG